VRSWVSRRVASAYGCGPGSGMGTNRRWTEFTKPAERPAMTSHSMADSGYSALTEEPVAGPGHGQDPGGHAEQQQRLLQPASRAGTTTGTVR
jgi:hypothetical protein